MRIEQIMSAPVYSIQSNATLDVAAHLMWEHDCGAIPVTNDKGKLVAIVTDRDICMATLLEGRPPAEIPIHIAMSKEIFSVRGEQTVAVAEELMASKQVRRIPVIDSDGKPIGILSINDLGREAALPRTKLQGGIAKVMQTFAAIFRPRGTDRADRESSNMSS